jgi:hypothetical protein
MHGHEQEKHDQSDRGDWGRKRQEGYQDGAAKVRRGNDGVAKAACQNGRVRPENPDHSLCEAGDAAAGDHGRRPFHHWRRIDHDSRRYDRPGDEGGEGRQSVEQVVDDRNDVGAEAESTLCAP